MFNSLVQNYGKVVKKLPQQAWKTSLYSVLIICWGAIIVGTFLLLK